MSQEKPHLIVKIL